MALLWCCFSFVPRDLPRADQSQCISNPCTATRRGFPSEIAFKTKPEIALDQLRRAYAAGLPCGVVLLDAGYGNNSELRADTTALGATYVAGILSTTTVWAPGAGPLPAKTRSGRARRPKGADAARRRSRSRRLRSDRRSGFGEPSMA
jgi:SRSO17 transposase